MACENALSISPGKRKAGNSEVAEIACALGAIATSKRGNPNDKTERGLFAFQEEEEEECLTTPKSDKHKIPAMKRCPPAPCKSRLTHRKRKPAIPCGTIYIPFDFPDLDLLFGSEIKPISQHTKKKKKKK